MKAVMCLPSNARLQLDINEHIHIILELHMHQGQGMVIMGIIHTHMLAGIRVFWRHPNYGTAPYPHHVAAAGVPLHLGHLGHYYANPVHPVHPGAPLAGHLPTGYGVHGPYMSHPESFCHKLTLAALYILKN